MKNYTWIQYKIQKKKKKEDVFHKATTMTRNYLQHNSMCEYNIIYIICVMTCIGAMV